ncbi:MAG: biopolymer transporter ExbD [Kiritimatiellae bacterium]|nr:biopolymer transporter ExbD [Kiritimatiellia bacterium]
MARKPQDNPQLDMTPMIDVVFELIIFFVVTIKQEDLFTKLNCNRPAPSTGPSKDEDSPNVTIEIGRRYDGSPQGVILYNKREVRRAELDAALRDIARTSTKTPVIVKCTGDSPHKALVDVLDICYRNNLFSVSVFSLDN